MRGEAEENKTSAKKLFIEGEKKKRRRFQQWSGFKFFYFILGLIIAWEISGGKIWRMNR